MRTQLSTFVVFCLSLIATSAAAGNTKEQMAQAYKTWCQSDVPDFDLVAAKATKKELPVIQHRKIPMGNGAVLEDEMWSVSDASGTFAIDAIQTVNHGKHMASCSVYFPDLTDDDLPSFLGTTLQLGAPKKQSISADGKQITFWGTLHPDERVMLASGSKGVPQRRDVEFSADIGG